MIYGVDVYISSNCPTTTTGDTATDRVGCSIPQRCFMSC